MTNCKHCQETILSKSAKVFCSSSCAAKYNNLHTPKRKPEGACTNCQKPISASRVYCGKKCEIEFKKNNWIPKIAATTPRKRKERPKSELTLRTIENRNLLSQNLRICGTCKKTKTLENFAHYSEKISTTCKQCIYKHQKDRWIQRKLDAIEYKGGKCLDCKHSFHRSVYDFHHRDPSAKKFTFDKAKLHTKEELYQELDKCDLLCSNCHRMRHVVWEEEKEKLKKAR